MIINFLHTQHCMKVVSFPKDKPSFIPRTMCSSNRTS